MKKLATVAMAALLSTGALADDKKPDAAQAPAMTIRDCLSILAGLSNMDSRKVMIGKGKPSEAVEVINYQFKGTVRDNISHDIWLLGPIQQEAQSADRRIRLEVAHDKPVVPGSKEESVQRAAFDAALADRVDEYVRRPCKVELDKIADADLKLDENDIPGTVLASIWMIRVK